MRSVQYPTGQGSGCLKKSPFSVEGNGHKVDLRLASLLLLLLSQSCCSVLQFAFSAPLHTCSSTEEVANNTFDAEDSMDKNQSSQCGPDCVPTAQGCSEDGLAGRREDSSSLGGVVQS